ncbi:MAG: hypothetical protein MUO53_06045 [Maribacter sp.]|nr:hypothetical protein [Maribacter sp.]
MKKQIRFLVIFVVLFFNCSKSEELSAPTESFQNTLTTGSWIVFNHTLYSRNIDGTSDSEIDDTFKYAGYVWSFNADGSVTAAGDIENATGSWQVDEKNRSSSFSLFEIKLRPVLRLDFDGPSAFQNLNSSWDVGPNPQYQVILSAENQSLYFKRN